MQAGHRGIVVDQIAKLRLLHLSDIHFQKKDGNHLDLDLDIRNELERDLNGLRKRLGAFEGILVTGDVAFSGQRDEYDAAMEWLTHVTTIAGCPGHHLWTVPGNHDVDRGVLQGNVIPVLRQGLRSCDDFTLDDLLKTYLEDPYAREALFWPFKEYNEFAKSFLCQTEADHLWWDYDLPLNDRSILRLRGVNSALVSDERDDDAANRLIVSLAQATITRQSGVSYLVMCHHPLTWLKSRDSIEDLWNTRSAIQLFGHKHRQRVFRINESAVLCAGATLPHRREPNWAPCYSVIEMWVEREGAARRLKLDIHHRIWHPARTKFMAEPAEDGRDYHSLALALDDWEVQDAVNPAPDDAPQGPLQDAPQLEGPGLEPSPGGEMLKMDAARRLAYRFLMLPYIMRMRIALDLELLEEADQWSSDPELYQSLFHRAKERQRLGDLWYAVEMAHPDSDAQSNPYVGK
jgi:hypothetical protein